MPEVDIKELSSATAAPTEVSASELGSRSFGSMISESPAVGAARGAAATFQKFANPTDMMELTESALKGGGAAAGAAIGAAYPVLGPYSPYAGAGLGAGIGSALTEV